MARPKKLTAADLLDMDPRKILRGVLKTIGSMERVGELVGELANNPPEMPSSTPESIRAQMLKEIVAMAMKLGTESADMGLANDPEALDAFIARHEANRPANEPEEEAQDSDERGPFDDEAPE
jgi:hypothetical protein